MTTTVFNNHVLNGFHILLADLNTIFTNHVTLTQLAGLNKALKYHVTLLFI